MRLFNQFYYRPAKKQQEAQADFENWAFPFGEAQKLKVESLLEELFGNKDKLLMVAYLMAKQEAKGNVDVESVKRVKKVLEQLKIKDVSKYMALLKADLAVDESLSYPSIEELSELAQHFGG